MILSNMFCKSTSMFSMPMLEKICTGTAFCSTVSSTTRSSSSPASSLARILSRVRCRRSCSSFSCSGSHGLFFGVGTSRSSSRSVTRSLRLRLHLHAHLLLDQPDAGFGEIADDALHVAADVADLGELGGLDLDERSTDQLRQPAGDLGFADAGGADEDDVLRGDVGAQFGGELLPPPAVADRDRDRLLRGVLPDDVLVEFGNDLSRGHGFGHG